MSSTAKWWSKGWTVLVALAVAAEMSQIRRPECTLSAATRYTFRTHTPMGRKLFIAGWAALTLWFVPHVVKEIAHDTAPGSG